MREQLRRLTLEIAQLDLSCNKAIQTLLEYPFPLNEEEVENDLRPYLTTLNCIFVLLKQWDQATKLKLRMDADKEILAGYHSQFQQNVDEFTRLELHSQKIKEKLSILYQQLEGMVFKAVANSGAPVVNISDLKSQIKRVSQLLHDFQQANLEVQLPLWLSKRAELILELQLFGVVAPQDDREGHQELYYKIQGDIGLISHYQDSLEAAQQNLAYFISDKNIQELENTLPLLQKNLQKINQNIDDFPLSDSNKQFLIEQCDKYDSQQLRWQREQEIMKLESVLNFDSWYRWMLDYDNYDNQIKQCGEELSFISLLEEKANIEASVATAQKTISQHEPTGSMRSEMTLFEIQTQGLEMIEKLKPYGWNTEKLDSLLRLNTDISATDLLTIFMEAMTYCANLKDKKMKGRDQLHRIIDLNDKIRDTQIQFDLVESTDRHPSHEKTSNNQTDTQLFTKIITLCQDYLSSIKELNYTNEHIHSLEENQNHLKKLMKRKQAVISRQSSALNISSIRDNLCQAIEKLQALPLIEEEDLLTVRIEEPTEEAEQLIKESRSVYDKDEILYWQRKIQSRYADMTPSTQQWYQELSAAIDEQVSTLCDYNKTCQLLRDIYFELKHPKTIPCSVLLNYQSTYRNSNDHLLLLLSMKPAFSPLEKKNFDQVKDESIARVLKSLYEKSEKLKHSYPVEAKLLYQATQSIHHTALLVEQNQRQNFMPYSDSILDDPRYERLKRHRGIFFKCWEQIEYCSRYIMHKIKGEEERTEISRCSFFKTHSCSLLLEAETSLSDLRRAKI